MTGVEVGTRVKVATYHDPDLTPWPGRVTAIGGLISGFRWVTVRLDLGRVVVVTDDKVSAL